MDRSAEQPAPAKRGGVLAGLKIIEMEALGPVPFAGMMLADHGADVICVRRVGSRFSERNILARSRRSIMVDITQAEGSRIVQDLCADADAILEGYRPGVMERLGLGPETLMARNPGLTYARMTGWGQTGPYAQQAGHDINYIAVAGVLDALGRKGDKPTPPINLIGDFGGGGMMLAFGVISSILNAQRGGSGQVIDCAMTDGSALLMSMMWWFRAEGTWSDQRGDNVLDTGAHFYDTYETADGKFLAIGAIEPKFYEALRQVTGLHDEALLDNQRDRASWPAAKERLAHVIKQRSRDEWAAMMEGIDACGSPVLSMGEAPSNAHNVARETFVEIDGVVHPSPAPRFSATPAAQPEPARASGAETEAVLRELGYSSEQTSALVASGVIQASARE
jgi:alpha-methylacyl-CoA racemase